jgi:hypothetical protein
MKNLMGEDSKHFGFLQFFAKSLGMLFIADWSLNIFHVLENRYTLQNNIKEFRGNFMVRKCFGMSFE